MRRWFIVTAGALVASLAGPATTVHAETGGSLAQLTSSSVLHKGTGLTFPPNLAGARLVRTADYGAQFNQPELGFSYHYATQSGVAYSIYIYGEAFRPQAGPDNPQVVAHFDAAVRDIRTIASMGRYRDLQLPDRADRCTYGIYVFRCVTFSALRTDNQQKVFSRLLVTGYRNHFLKIRIDWAQASDVAASDVELLTQTLLGAILR